jgi:hypothetical protein
MGASNRKAGQPARITTNQQDSAPSWLRCLICDASLDFVHSIEGGVVPVERWDRYECRRCGGAFEYRHRTRVLKRSA